jgi:hypothetical protein
MPRSSSNHGRIVAPASSSPSDFLVDTNHKITLVGK